MCALVCVCACRGIAARTVVAALDCAPPLRRVIDFAGVVIDARAAFYNANMPVRAQGPGLLNEFIQNADDAGATRVGIMLSLDE